MLKTSVLLLFVVWWESESSVGTSFLATTIFTGITKIYTGMTVTPPADYKEQVQI